MPETEYHGGPPLPRIKGFTGFIYVITNIISQKRYVGQTRATPEDRWNDHLRRARRETRLYALHAAINKYGAENFRIEEYCRYDGSDLVNALNALEAHFIKKLGTLVPCGYNLDSGGRNKVVHPETCARLSAANMGKPGRIPSTETRNRISQTLKGHPVSLETRAKLSVKNKGKVLSDETKAKIGAAGIGNQRTKGMKWSPESIAKTRAATVGRKRSPETLAKMRAVRLGKKASPETKAKISAAVKAVWARRRNDEQS